MAEIPMVWQARSMMLRTALVALALGSSLTPAVSRVEPVAAPGCPADTGLATLIAASDLVLVGRLVVPQDRLTEEAQKPAPGYLTIPIRVEQVLKGSDASGVVVRFYPKDAPYQPSIAAVRELAGKRAILFLTRVDTGPVGLYFAGYSPDALRPAVQASMRATVNETARQAWLLRSWKPDTRHAHFGEVQALIARLGDVSGDEQQAIFNRLEALGREAVPAIVDQMDNRRPLRTREMVLANRAPDAFEAVRHYGPEQVVDALAALLGQITGENFGNIESGGSDRARAAAVAGWRVRAADLGCRKAG